MIIFIDTESNSLPRNYKAAYTDVDNWPRITQLAISVRHDNGQIFYEDSWLVKPNGWTIPTVIELTLAGNKDPNFFVDHNMSTERCQEHGVEIYEVLNRFLFSAQECHTIVAHNLDFDLPVLQAELLRAGLPHLITLEQACTMKMSTDICQIPGPYGFKWPKLEELVAWLGGKIEGAHDAMNDVSACADSYFLLKERGLLPHKPNGIITYSNIVRHDNMPAQDYFKLSGYSHSFLKREKSGVIEKFEPSQKMLVGSLVDQILTDPNNVSAADPLYPKARTIAICIKSTFGYLIKRFKPQVSFTADVNYNGLTMPTTGRLDWLLERHAVIDLKFTSAKKIEPIVEHFGYRNQIWNYAKMAQVNKGYIIAYSDAIGDCLPVFPVDVTADYNDFWAKSVMKFGSVK